MPQAPPPLHQLCLNESPFGPLPAVSRVLAQAITQANRYPEFYPERLTELIAGRLGLPAEGVAVGSGSVGVALQLLEAVIEPGDAMVYSWRNFDAYPLLARMVGARPVEVPLRPDGRQDLGAMISALDRATKLVIMCNPHNPTGSLINRQDLTAFLRQIPENVVVVLDEAYIEFARGPDVPDGLALLAGHPNLLVLRTFSKAYGLAALRVGYGLARPSLIARVRSRQLPFGVNAFAFAAVKASLDATAELRQRIDRVLAERDRLSSRLHLAGWQALPSHANFVWLAEPDRAGECQAALAEAGVLARCYPGEGIRLTVGDRDANDAVLAGLGPDRAVASAQGATKARRCGSPAAA
jgi:histidinol-phosphate aminotransferase